MEILEDCISEENDNENHDGEYNVNESDNEDDFDALNVLQGVMESYDTSNN